jgi:hypothetical protein
VTRRRQRLGNLEGVPRRELLESLARRYHHLQREHQAASPESGVRRRLEDRLLDVRERFDRLLDEWVPEPELREAWREYLDHHSPAPEGPPAIQPLVFQGRSEAGAVVKIRGHKGEELAVEIDGSLVERVAAEKDLSLTGPSARFLLDHTEFEETFNASADALAALSDFLDGGTSPPWEFATELLGDGLIDTHFALIPRGRRALARPA